MTAVVTVAFGLAFFALILVSIALHEIGHMLPAKAFGVRVPKYFVGFGPTMWSVTRGETEYGIKWIPLGGFVRLLGMYPPGRPHRTVTRLSALADGAREYEWSEITDADVRDERLLYQKKTWQKLVVMAGGPMMNVLIAFLLFWAILALHGTYRPQPVVAGVQDCVIYADRADPTCTPQDPTSPAKLAGLAVGDRIQSFNGTAIADYRQLVQLIRANLDGPATVVVERGGQQITLATVNTVIDGVPDLLDPGKTVAAGWFGVSPEVALVKGGPVEAAGQMGELTQASFSALLQFPVKVYNVIADLVTGQPRDIYGPMSILGASITAGEVAANDDLSISDRVVLFASLLASVNLFLAVFNFLPLPPLDGGHIAGALYEKARRLTARALSRPDPGPFDTATLLPVAYVVGGFLILSGVALIIADILSPIQIF
ncbi:MAG: site-2 protease family protein [Micropruina sp.]